MRNLDAAIPVFNSYTTSAGELVKPVYSGRYAPDGRLVLVETDSIDIKAEINSYKDMTDMSYILSRLACGDTSVLNTAQPLYGDFTNFPKSYVEMLQLVQSGEDAFTALSPEIRSKFDNDVGQWFASIGSAEWNDKMGISPEPTVPSVDLPVNNVETIDKEVIANEP